MSYAPGVKLGPYDLGSVIGPVAAGLLIDHGSFGTALVVSAAVVAGCTLPGFRVPQAGFRAG